jgi:hypothetical protein
VDTQSPVKCFFCQEKDAEEKYNMLVHMHRVSGSSGIFTKITATLKSFGGAIPAIIFPDHFVTYESKCVTIPRCKHCKIIHDEGKQLEKEYSKKVEMLVCIIVATILGIIFGVPMLGLIQAISKSSTKALMWSLLFVISWSIFGAIVGAVGHSSKSVIRFYRKDYPEVKQLITAGWRFGESPKKKYGYKFVSKNEQQISKS